jgi:hypothetical protein
MKYGKGDIYCGNAYRKKKADITKKPSDACREKILIIVLVGLEILGKKVRERQDHRTSVANDGNSALKQSCRYYIGTLGASRRAKKRIFSVGGKLAYIIRIENAVYIDPSQSFLQLGESFP